jgi:hypothetical protein
MTGKKGWAALLIVGVLASSVSTAALADGRHGGGGGNGVALAAGIIGAVVVGSLIANSAQQPAYGPVYPEPQPYYPPQQVYYQAPPPVYYQPQPVAYVHEYRERREYREYRGYRRDDRRDGYRDGYYER